MKNNKTCICCGKQYKYCPHCSSSDNRPRWMNIFHNENCRELFHITSDYLAGKLTDEEAKEAFLKCDLSYQDELNDEITTVIKKVNVASVTKSSAKKTVAKTTVKTATKTTVTKEATDGSSSTEKTSEAKTSEEKVSETDAIKADATGTTTGSTEATK